MDRRGFLMGLFAVPVAAIVPVKAYASGGPVAIFWSVGERGPEYIVPSKSPIAIGQGSVIGSGGGGGAWPS